MAKYDRQLIVAFLAEGQEADTAAQAEALNQKERAEALGSEVVLVRADLGQEAGFSAASVRELERAVAGELRVAGRMTANSRLYLVGPGHWDQGKLAAWGPEQVADLLGRSRLPAVKVISIVADELGRDGPAAGGGKRPFAEGLNSFAAIFQRRLNEAHQIRTNVQARVLKVAVVLPPPGGPTTGPALGRKVTAREGESPEQTLAYGHHRPCSKVRLCWEGEQQQAEWAY